MNKRDVRTLANTSIVVAATIGVLITVAAFLPHAIDWSTYFRPAALAVLAGKSPYTVAGFYNPPWALIPLVPLALLPETVGRAVLFVLNLSAMALIVTKLGGNRMTAAAFLVSLPVAHGLYNGNIDWLAMLGFILPPQYGLLLVAIKPQVGVAVMLFWIVDAARGGGVRQVLAVSWRFIIVLSASIIIYGSWPAQLWTAISERHGGFSYISWPLSIPFGLAFIWASLRRRDIRLSMPASPCLAPQAMFHSWSAALVALANHPWGMIIASVGSWLVPALLAAVQAVS